MGVIGEIHLLGVAAWAPSPSSCGSWVAVGSLTNPAARGKAQLELFDILRKTQDAGSVTSLESERHSESKSGAIFGSAQVGVSDEFRIATAQPAVPSLQRTGGCVLSSGIRQIAWGAAGRGACSNLGIIATGLDDGTVQLWDVQALVTSRASGTEALLYGSPAHKRRHSGAVTALDFNPFVSTLLASGGPESAVFVWDLNEPKAPVVHPTATSGADSGDAAAGGGGAPPTAALLGAPSQVGCVQWNHRVQHILAAGLGNGNTVIWDLKQKRPVLSFSDPTARTRVSALAWNPEVATQVAVASDDDRNDIVKIWDLRNVHAPLRELDGHQQGVTALSWCPHDSGLLLSSGKDGRVIGWNPLLTTSSIGAEILFELPISANWSFALQWSPTIPGLFLTTDLGGIVTVWSTADRLMTGASAQRYAGRRDGLDSADRLLRESFGNAVFEGQVQATPAKTDDGYDGLQLAKTNILSYAPKWMRPPCKAVFGFGAQLAYVAESEPCGMVLQLESPLEELEEIVHQAIRLVQPDYDLHRHCLERAEQATSPANAQVWQVLSALLVPNSRLAVLEIVCGAESLPNAPQLMELNAGTIGLLLSVPPVQSSRVAPMLSDAELAAATEIIPEVGTGAAYAPRDLGQGTQPAASAEPWNAEQPPISAGPWDAPAPWEHGLDTVGASSVLDAPTLLAQEHAAVSDRSSEAGSMAFTTAKPSSGMPAERMNLREMLIRGELPTAIDICLRQGQIAEALMIATCAGPATWTRTLHEALQRSTIQNATTKAVLTSVVLGHFDEAISVVSTADWKDALALLLLQGTFDEIAIGCTRLAERLFTSDCDAALICALCAADIARATRLWIQQGYSGYDLLERILILRQILVQGNPTMDVAAVALTAEALQVVEQIAAALIERGAVQLADMFLTELGVVSDLADRIRQFLGFAAGAGDSINRTGANAQTPWTRSNQPWSVEGAGKFPPLQMSTGAANRISSNRVPGVGHGNHIGREGLSSMSSSSMPTASRDTTSVHPPPVNGYAPSRSMQTRSPTSVGAATSATWSGSVDTRQVSRVSPKNLVASQVAAGGAGVMPPLSSPTTSHMNDSQGTAPATTWSGMSSLPPTTRAPMQASSPTGHGSDTMTSLSSLQVPQGAALATGTSGAPSSNSMPTSADHSSGISVLCVDIRNLPVMPKQAATILQRVYAECAKRAVGGLERKKIQDIDRKLGLLLTRMSRGDISADAVAQLHRLCSELEQHHLNEANAIHTRLTREHYDGNSTWIMALKRLLEVAARVGY